MTLSARQVGEDAAGLLAHLLDQLLPGLAEAARDQLGLPCDAAVRAGERRDHDQHAVLREVPPVAEGHVVHVPHSQPVDERDARLNVVDDPRHAVA